MSPQMKLGDKPNKIGTKNGRRFGLVFTYSSPNPYTGKIYLIYLVESFPEEKKKEITMGFSSTSVDNIN